MATTAVPDQTHSGAVQRTVPLSKINVREDYNPRDNAEKAEIDRLARSIVELDVLEPVVLVDGEDGMYDLIDGERRYHACIAASKTEVPAIIRPRNSETDDLDVALTANMQRKDLDPVQEARGIRGLMERSGLTRRGVAQRLAIPESRVRERLEIMALPECLWPQVASGEIPLLAIRGLAAIAPIHADLPVLAVQVVLAGDGSGYFPYDWQDVKQNPLKVAVSNPNAVPDGIYLSGEVYPLDAFTLSDKARKDLGKLEKLLDEIPHYDGFQTVRFDGPAIDEAASLKAAYDAGYQKVIVGQDVADQLVEGVIARTLNKARADKRELDRRAEAAAEAGTGDHVENAGKTQEEIAKEAREAAAQQKQAVEDAVAYNAKLGLEVWSKLVSLPIDGRVVKVLSAFDIASNLGTIAKRGARLGFPDWVTKHQFKNGNHRWDYLTDWECADRAAAFIARAKTPEELAGRQIALLVMARLADEATVLPASRRSYHFVTPGHESPWAGEALALLDEIAAEHLSRSVLERTRDLRADERNEAKVHRADQAWFFKAWDALPNQSAKQRESALARAAERFGEFCGEYRRFEARVTELNERDQAAQEGGDTTTTA